MQHRCPSCNKFGKDSLKGYCTPCYEKGLEITPRKRRNHFFRAIGKPNAFKSSFTRDAYGIVSDKFRLED